MVAILLDSISAAGVGWVVISLLLSIRASVWNGCCHVSALDKNAAGVGSYPVTALGLGVLCPEGCYRSLHPMMALKPGHVGLLAGLKKGVFL